jgi:hypothetical protein
MCCEATGVHSEAKNRVTSLVGANALHHVSCAMFLPPLPPKRNVQGLSVLSRQEQAKGYSVQGCRSKLVRTAFEGR